ncbi:dTDP-4-dehydrorhamnose 3,5-epimerase [Leeia aquatica]|uniref:dTDP-4-dehydrorhamnose 3,5-epimerase n=1 Tax=Leeia aquatica TaxID=2725557 RepID=A0A847SBH1_9NEIS|nr:dTDP-4-dehydrorhamnose 3,5-epimerase [Leeia aquatica]NLR76247.1 dTDP-4-dehydrorhamnose 3,5-epimerase [Leeia aquatica]
MRIIHSRLHGVLILEPDVYRDSRGFFLESYNQKYLDSLLGTQTVFVQDNHSRSSRGVLRGLHYQLPPFAQGKLVRVTSGRIYDVAVDLRRDSPAYGQWDGVELSAENHRQLWIPPGFAHGFLVLSDTVDVLYKATAYYAPETEGSIRWDDPTLAIDWPLEGLTPLLSGKDQNAPCWAEAKPWP